MSSKQEFLMSSFNRKRARGVEIGPFYNPIAPRRDGWQTRIVDFAPTETIVGIARSHSMEIVRESAHLIEEVDYIWDGTGFKDMFDGESWDYVLASHSAEHFPDLLAFLKDAEQVLSEGGELLLALPDARRCFDVYRAFSNTASIMRAHRLKLVRHEPETMLEQQLYCSEIGRAGSWLYDDGNIPRLCNSVTYADRAYRDYLQSLESGRGGYVDLHAWVFTPATFQLVIYELNMMGEIGLAVTKLEETTGADFWVKLSAEKLEAGEAQQLGMRQHLLDKHRYEMREVVLKG